MRLLHVVPLLLAACNLGPPATGDGVGTDTDPDTVDTVDPPDTETELPCDEVDGDADGTNACDDCDDADALVHPGAPERCNGRDDDCDLALAPEEDVDADGDGAADCAVCDEAGYWATTRELAGDALVAELHALSADQHCTNYSIETTYMFTVLDKEADGMVECVYTGIRVPVVSQKPDSTVMNTEHTWPQSQGADVSPMECDLHHLYPTDSDANNRRGSDPFGEVVSDVEWYYEPGESATGETKSGERAWEPRDSHKGNVARSMLYFAMRYGYDTSASDLALYKSWNALDPVDDREITRSMMIRDREGEANPYVVCDGLVDRL